MKKQGGDHGFEVVPDRSQTLKDIAGNPAALLDFRHFLQVPNDRFGSVDELSRTLLRRISSSLAITLRCYVHGQVLGIEQTTYGAFSDERQTGACLAFLSLSGTEETCALSIGEELIAPVLDLMMGGDGLVSSNAFLDLTEVERDLLQTPVELITGALTEAWGSQAQGEFRVRAISTNPGISDFLNRSEAVLSAVMRLKIGGAEGTLTLAIPGSLTKRMAGTSNVGEAISAPAASDADERTLRLLRRELLLDVDFELRGSSMRLSDLASLRPATVVDLGVPCDGAVAVSVNGKHKFGGWLVQADSKMTVTIE